MDTENAHFTKRGIKMTDTYQEYLKGPQTLTLDQMTQLHEEMISEIENDSDAQELYHDLIEKATSYASLRAKWHLMSQDEKMEKDPLRTSYHDAMIIHFNMLSRYLRMQGEKAEWRDQLGYEEDDKYCRKTIGDFGCYIVFINSICAR